MEFTSRSFNKITLDYLLTKRYLLVSARSSNWEICRLVTFPCDSKGHKSFKWKSVQYYWIEWYFQIQKTVDNHNLEHLEIRLTLQQRKFDN